MVFFVDYDSITASVQAAAPITTKREGGGVPLEGRGILTRRVAARTRR